MKLVVLVSLAAVLSAAELKLGKPLALKDSTPLVDLMAQAEKFVGKTVQVRGRVAEVCEMAGCWMNLVDPSGQNAVRVKVNDGEITFPKTSVGKIAVAEGRMMKLTLTREQAVARAKHEAEEQGRRFDPASVKSGAVIYQIQGVGAVVLE